MQGVSVDHLVGQILGNYRIERLLGKGHLNAVYLAHNLASQRMDALTLYLIPERFTPETHNRFLTRFFQEAAAISALQHRHILPLYAYGEHAGHPYLATPYMMNGSLANILKQQGRHTHTEILDILEPLAQGLAYAHSQGHIHGTLKPSNIVLSNEKTLLVAGFGLMNMLQLRGLEHSNQPYAHLLSIAHTFLAAPEYIAPEMVQGQQIGTPADVYALGIILFELLSGRPPFTGTNPLDIAQQHVQQSIPPLRTLCPDIPVALESVINQALDRDPTRRFRHISELAEAFVQVSLGATGHLQRYSPNQLTDRVADTYPATPRAARTHALQDTPESGYLANSWQLLPPIVTGGMPSIRLSIPSGSTLSRTPAAPVLPMPSMPVARVPEQNMPQARPASPGHPTPDKRPGESIRPFDWWSMPGQVQEASPVHKPETALVRPSHTLQPARTQGPLRLGGAEMTNWGAQPIPLNSTNAVQLPNIPQRPQLPNRAKKRPAGRAKGGRRKVVAMLATAGVAAAGAGLVFNLPHILALQATTGTPAGKTTTTTSQAVATKTTVPQAKATPTTQPPQGVVIGKTNIAINSALVFTNPADHRSSLLIHLPNGNFVAYERACTHEGVSVNYDPGTHMLVCPAHGAIFNPANGGQVVQGPATRPIAKVNVRVNANGTITVA